MILDGNSNVLILGVNAEETKTFPLATGCADEDPEGNRKITIDRKFLEAVLLDTSYEGISIVFLKPHKVILDTKVQREFSVTLAGNSSKKVKGDHLGQFFQNFNITIEEI